jgi:CRISPR-associated protein Cst2
MTKGLTITIIFQANSLNYGEGMGNVSELKKLSRANGQTYTFASRQCLRYDIVRLGHEWFGWKIDTVTKESGKGATIQFAKDASIKESEEMDLFGYMKTVSGQNANTREAVARLSHAISLEPYHSDLDFLNNMGLASRLKKEDNKDSGNNLANIEQHFSFYTYTLTIDLDRVGVDHDVQIDAKEKKKRVEQLLTLIQFLSRNIRGRQENLSPLFIIGGLYPIANPFFYGRIRLRGKNGEFSVDTNLLEDGLEKRFMGCNIKEYTHLGLSRGLFRNETQLLSLLPEDQTHTVQGFFDQLQEKVANYYLGE